MELEKLFKKYNIKIIDNKRCYEIDLLNKTPQVKHSVPYLFIYNDEEIKDNNWKKLELNLVRRFDSENPKSKAELLNYSYYWSKQKPFSLTKKANHEHLKDDIYINLNHESDHALMNIQFLFEIYNKSLKDCSLFIRKHFVVEPDEVKNAVTAINKTKFKEYLGKRNKSEKYIENMFKIIDLINKESKGLNIAYDNFYIFDDYNYFLMYRNKVITYLKEKYFPNDSLLKAYLKAFDDLTGFYRQNKNIYD